MVEINENLEKEEVNSLIFLLGDYIPRMKMAKHKVCFSALIAPKKKTRLKTEVARQQIRGDSTARGNEAGVDRSQEVQKE